MKKALLHAAVLVAFAVCPLCPATAQTKPTAKPADKSKADVAAGFIGETVSVNIVNVDVYVTDKKGNRVTGLSRDDFQVFEDGRPVAITNFFAMDGGKVAQPPAAVPATPAPGAPPAPEVSATLPPTEDQRLVLIVYVDNFNLRPFNRNRVLKDLRVFLNTKLQRDDLMMLVSYDRSVHIRQPLTSDPGLINSQLVAMEKISAQGTAADSERRDALQRIDDSPDAGSALGIARSYAESQFNDLAFSIDALRDIVNGLAGMPGRKAVLYVSDGLQLIVGQDVYYAVQEKFKDTTGITQSFDYDASRRFRELTSTANANRVTFYTLDAAGLRSYSSISAENQTAGQGVFIDQIQIQNVQSSIRLMADETGGKALFNTNNFLPGLERIAEDFRSFYSLGYSPQHSGDGRYHEIQVKLKKKGLEVRHRAGYRDKSPETQMNDGTLAALNFPFQSNPMGVDINFGTPTRRSDGFFLVPVDVRIPLGKLVLIPRETENEAAARVFVAAQDSKGGVSEVQQAAVPIRIPNDQVATIGGKYYTYSLSLLMRAGDQKVAVGLRDDVANTTSFVARTLRVGG
ncbi:MAG TPA: VWA domain-containing protein [Thermoanaerobaculia bacterium]|jgi:VWFA-related protein|nr:VWA domain-containing protein [Thermoanaerobaculia bacterium]